MGSHRYYDVIRDGVKIKLKEDETLTFTEYKDLIHRNSQEYLYDKRSEIARKVFNLLSQRIQDGIKTKGFTIDDRKIYFDYQYIENSFSLNYTVRAYFSLNLYMPFIEFYLFSRKKDCIGDLVGTIEEFDDILCLIALHTLLPTEENSLFTLV